MSTLRDVPDSDWSQLAQDYADTNAVLVPRIFYRGYSKSSGEEVYIIDDYTLPDNNYALYRIIGTKKETYSNVLTLCARMIDLDDNYVTETEVEFDWNPVTFSWCHRNKSMDDLDSAFDSHGVDVAKNHYALVDIPFGHVVAFSANVQQILDNALSPFYSSKWAQLGPIGAAISQKANIYV